MVRLLGAYSIGTLLGRPCMLSPEWGNGTEPTVTWGRGGDVPRGRAGVAAPGRRDPCDLRTGPGRRGSARVSSPGPATRDVCAVVVDEGTTSITGACVEPTALLARAADWERKQGHVRCSVDFETANGPAARFWMQHFAAVVVWRGRTLDPRLARA